VIVEIPENVQFIMPLGRPKCQSTIFDRKNLIYGSAWAFSDLNLMFFLPGTVVVHFLLSVSPGLSGPLFFGKAEVLAISWK
jgi:hypothetical protein